MVQFELNNEKDLLTKVHPFNFRRKNKFLPIEVHEVIAGQHQHKFIAVPTLVSKAKKEYHGYGASIEEALKDCLTKIKSVSRDDMF